MPVQEDISPVHSDDYPRVVEVWEASVRATHHFVAESDIEIFRPMVRGVLPHIELACIRDNEGAVAGFTAVAHGKVEMLFIHPDWRGQGVGRRLLNHAVEAMGATGLDCNEQNDQALGFYKRMGFEVVGRSELDGTGKPYPILHMELVDKK
jgi:putative acetyltransferase